MNASVSKYVRNGVSGVFAFAAASAICPLQAFADDGAGISAILPEMSEFLPMLIAFIILWIILAKFGWPLFEGMLVKREQTIQNSLDKAEEAKQESERLLAEYQDQLEGAKAKSQQMINNAIKSAEAQEAEILAKARVEADAITEKAKANIETERQIALKELQENAVDLSIAVAGRLIGEGFSDDEHRKLIERYVKEAGSLNAN